MTELPAPGLDTPPTAPSAVPPTVTPAAPSTWQRPGPARLLWYSVGGSLPARHSSWVLHDVTCGTWLLRHVARTLLIITPLLLLYLTLVPASLGIRLLTGLTFAGGALLFSLVNTLVDTDRRAVRAGYDAGLPARIRTHQSVERQRSAAAERRERIAQRRARRLGGR